VAHVFSNTAWSSSRAGQTNSTTTLDLFLLTSGDRPSYGAMVERREGLGWLRDDDDDVEQFICIDYEQYKP